MSSKDVFTEASHLKKGERRRMRRRRRRRRRKRRRRGGRIVIRWEKGTLNKRTEDKQYLFVCSQALRPQ